MIHVSIVTLCGKQFCKSNQVTKILNMQLYLFMLYSNCFDKTTCINYIIVGAQSHTCKRGISLYNIYAKYNKIRHQFSFFPLIYGIFDKTINCVLDRAQSSFKKSLMFAMFVHNVKKKSCQIGTEYHDYETMKYLYLV